MIHLKGIAAPAAAAPAAPFGENVSIKVAVESDRVAMRFGTGKLLLPAPVAALVAGRLAAAAIEAAPPPKDEPSSKESGQAQAAVAVERAYAGDGGG